MSVLVVDASVLVAAIGGAVDAPEATWARELIAHQRHVITCDIADVECVSAWRRQRSRGLLTDRDVAQVVSALREAPLTRVPTWALTGRMLELSAHLSPHLNPFDAAYVAVAESLNAPLATLDRRLARAPGITCEVVTCDRAGNDQVD